MDRRHDKSAIAETTKVQKKKKFLVDLAFILLLSDFLQFSHSGLTSQFNWKRKWSQGGIKNISDKVRKYVEYFEM